MSVEQAALDLPVECSRKSQFANAGPQTEYKEVSFVTMPLSVWAAKMKISKVHGRAWTKWEFWEMLLVHPSKN